MNRKKLTTLCILCTMTAIYATKPDDALIMNWKFDEPSGDVVTDSSEIHNPNGRIFNVERCEGISGGALRFKGEDSYLAIPKPGSISPVDGLTLTFSFKPEKLSGVQYIMGSGGTPMFFARIAENFLEIAVQVPDVAWREIRCYTPLKNGEWYHVVFSIDCDKAVCYLNGEKAGEVAITGVKLTNTAILFAGRTFWNKEGPFYGIVDELKLYSKAFTADELNNTDTAMVRKRALLQRIGKLGKKYLLSSIVKGTVVPALAELRKIKADAQDMDCEDALSKLEAAATAAEYKLPEGLSAYAISPTTPEKILPDTNLEKLGLVSAGELSIIAAPGEYEAASVVLRSKTQLDKFKIAVKIDGIPDTAIDSKYVVCWKQNGGIWTTKKNSVTSPVYVPELLLNNPGFLNEPFDKEPSIVAADGSKVPPVRDAEILLEKRLPAETNQQMLVTVHVPENQQAGLYKGVVSILDGKKILAEIPLNVRVLPFQLSTPRTHYDPTRDMTYSVYYWGEPSAVSMPHVSGSSLNDKQFAAEMRDLAAHGISSPIFIWSNELFFNKHDLVEKGITAAREAGLCKKDIYFGMSGNTDPRSASEMAVLCDKIRNTVALFRKIGITGDIYMYCRDEQRLPEELKRQLPAMYALHKAGVKLLVSCFGGAFDHFGGILDLCIWYGVPNLGEAAKWHSKNGLIWNYGAPQAGTENPAIYRRNFGLLLWKMNYDGASDYCYADPHKEDRFAHGWNFVYQTTEGVIRTIYWDGFREAVDDVRYASTLQSLIAGKTSDSAMNAQRFLDSIDPKNDDSELLRLEIIQHILAVQK